VPSDVFVAGSATSVLLKTVSIVEEVLVGPIDGPDGRRISGPIEVRDERGTLSELLTLHVGDSTS